MAVCKCGLSSDYPNCNGTHNQIAKNEKLRQAIIKAFEDNKDLLEE